MDIDAAVWSEWREQFEEAGADFFLLLALESPSDPAAVAAALEAALLEVATAFAQLQPRPELEFNAPLFGVWDWLRFPDRVALSASECDDLALALTEVARALERRGIGGRLRLWDRPRVEPDLEESVALACRIRVRGTRRALAGRGYTWDPDPGALAELVRAACAWAQLGDDADYSLDAGALIAMRWPAGVDVSDRVLETIARRRRAWFIAAKARGGRSMSADPYAGGLGLTAFGTRVNGDAWRAELASLTEFLRGAADSITYAYIVRGLRDWPQRPERHPRGPAQTDVAFQDLYVPDAFGVQLLDFRDRVPSVTLWRASRAGRRGTLLEATDPDAWFSEREPPHLPARAELARAPLHARDPRPAARAELLLNDACSQVQQGMFKAVNPKDPRALSDEQLEQALNDAAVARGGAHLVVTGDATGSCCAAFFTDAVECVRTRGVVGASSQRAALEQLWLSLDFSDDLAAWERRCGTRAPDTASGDHASTLRWMRPQWPARAKPPGSRDPSAPQ